MRTIAIVALAAVTLSACANDQDTRQAVNDCQSVGIAPNDPDYAVCQQAYIEQHRENHLSDNYRVKSEVERSIYRRNTER